jgi:hypothetical protein
MQRINCTCRITLVWSHPRRGGAPDCFQADTGWLGRRRRQGYYPLDTIMCPELHNSPAAMRTTVPGVSELEKARSERRADGLFLNVAAAYRKFRDG